MNNNLKKILSMTACVTLLFAFAPIVSSAPTITLKATPGCNEIQLSWNKIDIASFYQPFMTFDDGSAYPLTDFPTAETVFVHKNLEEGKQYCYLVKAFDKDSKEALKSEKVCAKTECKGNGNIGNNTTDGCKVVLDFQIGNKEYKVNGKVKGTMAAAPKIGVGNRTMIVVKYFIDEYGGTTAWDPNEKKVTLTVTGNGNNGLIVGRDGAAYRLTRINRKIELWIGKKDAVVDGITMQIDPTNANVVPIIESGRTLLPFRFIGEKSDIPPENIEYLAATKTIRMSWLSYVCFAEKCDWTQKGKIIGASESNNTIDFDTNCDDVKDFTYNCFYTLLPENGPNDSPIIGRYRGCAQLCINSLINTATKWKPLPNDPDCCATTNPNQKKANIQVMIEGDCAEGAQVEIRNSQNQIVNTGTCNEDGYETGCVLECPENYVVRVTKPGIIFTPETIDVSFDDCCEDGLISQVATFYCPGNTPNPPPVENKGRIVAKINGDCGVGSTIVIKTIDNVIAATGTVNADYEFDTGCVLDCSKEYIVTPIKSGVIFNPPTLDISFDADQCCPGFEEAIFECSELAPQAKGRITVELAGDAFDVDGSTIKIINDLNGGEEVFEGTLSEDGFLDTGCVFDCPGSYTVIPSKPGVIFMPPSRGVAFLSGECCPSHHNVSFICSLDTSQSVKAEIVVLSNVIDASVIIADDATGAVVSSGLISDYMGEFRTGCVLDYPKTYNVSISKNGCVFSPSSKTVYVEGPDCPASIYVVLFGECDTSQLCSPVTGCIAWVDQSGNDFNVAIKNDCNTDAEFEVYSIYSDLKNTNDPKRTISQWLELFPYPDNNLCINACVNENSRIVSWECYPNTPNCGISGRWGFSGKTRQETVILTITNKTKLRSGKKNFEIFNDTSINLNAKVKCIISSGDGKKAIKSDLLDVAINTDSIVLKPKSRGSILLTASVPEEVKPGTIFYRILELETKELGRKYMFLAFKVEEEKSCDLIFRTKPEVKIAPLRLCPGEEVKIEHYELYNDTSNEQFTISSTSSSNSLKLVAPKTPFTIKPKQRVSLSLILNMPSDCSAEKNYVFSFVAETKECGKKEYSVSASCKDCAPNCDFGFFENRIGKFPETLCKGKSTTTTVTLINSHPTKNLELEIAGSQLTAVSSSSLIIKPKETGSFAVTFKMPDSCQQRSYNAQYTITPKGCQPLTKTFQINCDPCVTCCDFSITQKSQTKTSLSLCPGEKTEMVYTLKNNCKDTSTQFTLSGINVSFSQSSITLSAGGSVDFTAYFTMPRCKTDERVNFSFVVKGCEKEITQTLTIICKDCSICCDYEISEMFSPKELCPGEKFDLKPVLKNSKCSKSIKFVITPGANVLINGSSSSFVTPIAIPAGGTMMFTVTYVMPSCKAGSSVNFSWTIKPENCEPKTITSAIACKSCTACTTIEIKVTKVTTSRQGTTIEAGIKQSGQKDRLITLFDPFDKIGSSKMSAGLCYKVCYNPAGSTQTTNDIVSWSEIKCPMGSGANLNEFFMSTMSFF